MKPVAMVDRHPTLIDDGADRLVTVELIAKVCSKSQGRFRTGDRGVRRGVQVAAERVHAANGSDLNGGKRGMIDLKVVEPDQRDTRTRESALNVEGFRQRA